MTREKLIELKKIERTVNTIRDIPTNVLLELHELNKQGVCSRFISRAYFEEFKRRGLRW